VKLVGFSCIERSGAYQQRSQQLQLEVSQGHVSTAGCRGYDFGT